MKLLFVCALLFGVCLPSFAEEVPSDVQDNAEITNFAQSFIAKTMVKTSGTHKIVVAPLSTKVKLPHCDTMQGYFSNPNHVIGKTMVGVKCTSPQNWNIFLPASIQLFSTYLTLANNVQAGYTFYKEDIVTVNDDISGLTQGYLTDANQVIGQVSISNISAGTVLRKQLFKPIEGVTQGQNVRVVSRGDGFEVTTEGRALQTGIEGKIVEVRTSSGQVISGTAKHGGIVEVVN